MSALQLSGCLVCERRAEQETVTPGFSICQKIEDRPLQKGLTLRLLWSLFLRVSSVLQSASSVKQTSALSPVPEQKLEQLVPLNKLYHRHPNSGTRNSLEEFQVRGLPN